jgi:hypothetical protein
MLPFANVMNLFAYKLARLCGWRFAGSLVGTRALERFLLRHSSPPAANVTQRKCHRARDVTTAQLDIAFAHDY